MSPALHPPRHAGFSMIEVMVTIVIVAVGLLGLASLLLKGLQAGSISLQRSLAVAQAYDMADRMRANAAGVASSNYDTVLPTGSATTCSSGTISTANVAPPSSTGSCAACSSASCSVSDIATRDQCQWHQANNSLLPQGAGAVCKSAGNNWYTIFVSWDEGKTGSPNRTFSLRFEP